MKASSSPLSRRRFLALLGATGGSHAVAGALSAWGLLPASTQRQPPPLEGSGNGIRVLVLGAGLAGMTTAIELGARGYDCTIVEARERSGGRVYTLRGGTQLRQVGRPDYTVPFEAGLWFNPGPWRIPHSHAATLHYCQRFGVPLEVFTNDNENGWVARADDDRIRVGTLRADARGRIGELLAKVAGDLDASVSPEDEERLVEFLRNELGLAARDLAYTGDDRRGYEVFPGAGADSGRVGDPLRLGTVLDWAGDVPGVALLGLPTRFFQQPMLHPVGGMDRIADAFEAQLPGRILFRHEVRLVRQDERGVRVIVRDLATATDRELGAEFAVAAIPTSVLNRIDGDWSADTRRAFAQIPYLPVGKLGLQASSRFWEVEDQIYGGHSYTSAEMGTISYPSTEYHAAKGILQGFYLFGGQAVEISALDQPERARRAIASAAAIHPDIDNHVEAWASHFWHLERYNLGGWAEHTAESRAEAHIHLLEPDGRVYFAGEHLSYMPAWMAGAIESAWFTIAKLHERAQQERPA